MTNIIPRGARVLVSLENITPQTAGGIVLPGTADIYESLVLAVGEGYRTLDGTLIPMNIEVGDTIIHRLHVGFEIKLEGKSYKIYEDNDILGVRKKEND